METGVITSIIDCGSVVQVFIKVACDLNGKHLDCEPRSFPLAADGNMWRRGPAGIIHVGDTVEFEASDWGGLLSIAPAE